MDGTIERELGIPTVTVVGAAFETVGRAGAVGIGIPDLRLAVYPGVFEIDSEEKLQKDTTEILYPQILKALTEPLPAGAASAGEPSPKDIVFSGTFEEVNQYFNDKLWGDGLPIVPPTLDKVQEFLKYTDRSPDELLGRGVLPPANRELSIWTIAVNGVMAGARPEYMPVLIAAAEVLADPHFVAEEAISSGGSAFIILLAGPIVEQLGFESRTAVLRPGKQANSSVSRFLWLIMRNVAGNTPGIDPATFGNPNWPVLAENQGGNPWEPLQVSLGFKEDSNVVFVTSAHVSKQYTASGTGQKLLESMTWSIAHNSSGGLCNVVTFGPECTPLLVVSPAIANQLADAGFSKADIQQYIFENALQQNPKVCSSVEDGLAQFGEAVADLAPMFCPDPANPDPEAWVPMLHRPEELKVVVSGDPGRNRFFTTSESGQQGLGTAAEIKLPANWDQLLKDLGY